MKQSVLIILSTGLILFTFFCWVCFSRKLGFRDFFSNEFVTFLHKNVDESARTGGGGKKHAGYYQTGKRDTTKRLDLVSQKVNFKGKNVLNLGCNAGDFLLKLAPEIEFGVGVDFDPSRINEANFNARKAGFNNIIYYVDDLRAGNEMEFINAFPTQKVDIVMMYAVCDRWLSESVCKRIVNNSAKIANTLVIEVNRTKKFHRMPLVPYLSTVFESVEEITDLDYCPDCRTRRLFVCKNRFNK